MFRPLAYHENQANNWQYTASILRRLRDWLQHLDHLYPGLKPSDVQEKCKVHRALMTQSNAKHINSQRLPSKACAMHSWFYFQPIRKNIKRVKLHHFPKERWKNQNFLKPPPRWLQRPFCFCQTFCASGKKPTPSKPVGFFWFFRPNESSAGGEKPGGVVNLLWQGDDLLIEPPKRIPPKTLLNRIWCSKMPCIRPSFKVLPWDVCVKWNPEWHV